MFSPFGELLAKAVYQPSFGHARAAEAALLPTAVPLNPR
jgi:hypothetical protein